jgi:hypothetical protein
MKIDWKRLWLKENLEDARKEVAARPAWMKDLITQDQINKMREKKDSKLFEEEYKKELENENLYWE